MNDREAFFDTNVLLYLLSADERKADTAEKAISHGGIVSVQVRNEFTSVARRKLRMPWVEIRGILSLVRELCGVQSITLQGHDRAMALAEQHGFPIYDATIVASALLAGASTLYSEDMQDGRIVDGLTIRNPFAQT